MWRICAALCVATGLVGFVYADSSPGRTGDAVVRDADGSYAGVSYYGICAGKRVESKRPFRSCEEWESHRWNEAWGIWCPAGVSPEDLAKAREEGQLRYRAEQLRIANLPFWKVMRDALNPFTLEEK
jgi:hypothetical protein